jgi:hypothetical protein
MDKLFGELDYVDAGEHETAADEIEAKTYGNTAHVEYAVESEKMPAVESASANSV